MFETTASQTLPEVRAKTPAVEGIAANPAAFKAIYEEYFPRIYRYCLRRVSVPQEAEDLAGLVFTRAWAGRQSYRGGSVAAWLFRIAHNAVANHLRDRRATIPLDEISRLGEDDETLGQLVEAEDRQRVARLIAALPDEQRELLALRVAGSLSSKEIAEVTGKSDGAVRVAFHRIIQELRQAWAEEQAR